MLNTLRYKSSVLFGTHALLDKSLKVLQLPRKLWICERTLQMDISEILDCTH